MENRTIGHFSALAAAVLFALNIPATSYVLFKYIDPLAYSFVRVVIGTIICWLCSFFVKSQKIEKKMDIAIFAFCGILGLGVLFYFYSFGIGTTSPIDASIILPLVPFIVLIIAAFVF